jgi:predicted nucleic acid-binding protein
MIVVADSSPLIYLAAIGKFALLQTIYQQIIIPQAVYDEVVTQGAGRWGASETAGAAWIDCRTISDPSKLPPSQANLDLGEREVIGLAEELHANLVLMDEAAGRRELSKRGIKFLGTVGLLIQAKRSGLIAALKPELEQLRACGFHLSDRVIHLCLASVGE